MNLDGPSQKRLAVADAVVHLTCLHVLQPGGLKSDFLRFRCGTEPDLER